MALYQQALDAITEGDRHLLGIETRTRTPKSRAPEDSSREETHHGRTRMTYTMADYAYHLQAVKAFRSTGARIYEAHDRFYGEVRSTLRAMGVSR